MISSKQNLKSLGLHIFLIITCVLLLLPLYIALVTASHSVKDLLQGPVGWSFGPYLLHTFKSIFAKGLSISGGQSVIVMMFNSFIMATVIAAGKILLALLSAFAVVYFRFPLRKICFFLIFVTLMLPVEVRILPTFEVTARLHLLNSYSGLTLPLLASATATFLFRQFFLAMPNELVEAAKIDGAGPIAFFRDILLPLSKTNIAALFIIMFIYGWNQYLWPLVVTTQPHMKTIVMGIGELASVADQVPQWNTIMATSILALLPPVLVIVCLQRLFTQGLMDVSK